MKSFSLFATLVACGLSLFSQVVWGANDLVQIGSVESITKEDLSAYVARRVDLRSVVKSEWGLKMALTEMAETRVLVLEGLRIGEPRAERPGDERFDDVYALAVYRKTAPKCEKPADEQDARRYFEAHPEAFTLPVQMRLSRVMISAKSNIDNMSAEVWIGLQARAIASGATSFDKVAERARHLHSLDAQGDLGWVLMSEEVPLLRAIASANPGEMVGPVQEGDYWYLFSVLGRRDARQLKWEEVSKQVPTRAVQYCTAQARSQKREEMFKRYGVKFDDQAIRALSIEGALGPRQAQ